MIELPTPPSGPAWEHGPTRENMRARARRVRLWLTATVAAAVAVVPICVLLGVPGLIFLAESLLVLLALPLEVSALVALRRTELVLRTYGWEAFPASFEMINGGAGQRVKIEFARGQTVPFSGGVLNRSPEGRSRRAHPELVWFAGDRRLGGVTSPVAGGYPVLIYRQRRAKGKAARGTAEADTLAQKAGLNRAPRG